MTKLQREQALREWCYHQLLLPSSACWSSVSGDASFRRYFRIRSEQRSWIAVDSPPETEKNAEFIAISRFLAGAGVSVPKLEVFDLKRGFMLLTDLGDQTLLPLLTPSCVDSYYQSAIEMLLKIQSTPIAALLDSGQYYDVQYDGIPLYDAQQLNAEMQLFVDWFVEGLLSYKLSESEQQLLRETFDRLTDSALAQAQCFVHRDFHSRNIMVSADHTLAAIDFQDAVVGPVSYDLVSLLRDCYISWPEADVTRWCKQYFDRARSTGVLAGSVDFTQFMVWFDLMGLQRHIKVLGIFARLSLRDSKNQYLADLPLVIRYLRDVAGKYTELSAFVHWFETTLMAKVNAQPWMSTQPIPECNQT